MKYKHWRPQLTCVAAAKRKALGFRSEDHLSNYSLSVCTKRDTDFVTYITMLAPSSRASNPIS